MDWLPESERIFTVSELTRGVRACLERRFAFVAVAGEVSGLGRPASGHIYFTLKDGKARLRAVLFRSKQRWQAALPEDGRHVVCHGRLSVYEPRGEYQLMVESVEEQGAGDLRAELERLKRRLAAEGLFDPRSKRPLPRFPEQVVLLTSATGAAVHDFIRVARGRFPTRISIHPCPVQGKEAAALLRAGIERVNRCLPGAEVLVLCRGGGSGEDLHAFNDESLARAIRASRIPVVSAVGHEIDTTIADLAADLRAPTPSAAAEMILPEAESLEQALRERARAMTLHMEQRLRWTGQRLDAARRLLARLERSVEHAMLRLDHAAARLEQAVRHDLEHNRQRRLDLAASRLRLNGPDRRVAALRARLDGLGPRLRAAGQTLVERRRDALGRQAALLQAVSPLGVLSRGYALARAADGRILRQADQVRPGERLRVLLHRGELDCLVEGVRTGRDRRMRE